MSGKKWAKNLFYVWLLVWPLVGRKVFLTEFSHYTGAFTEQGTLFLYWSDFLLFGAVFSALFSASGRRRVYGVWKTSPLLRKTFYGWCILTLIMISGILGNPVYKTLILFKVWQWFKVGGVILLFSFVLHQKAVGVWRKVLKIVMISGVIQALIATYQFICQVNLFTHPLLRRFFGETELSVEAAGVAKILLDGEKLLRGYGTFPHPNMLGGFLILTFGVSFFLYLEHKNLVKSREKPSKNYLPPLLSWVGVFLLQLLGLMLTFSRSAWLGFIFFICFFTILFKIVSRETIYKEKKEKIVSRETFLPLLKTYKELFLAILLVLVFMVFNSSLFLSRVYQDTNNLYSNQLNQESQSFSDRNFFQIVSRETIAHNPLLGSGAGTAIFQFKTILGAKSAELQSWQFQPTHNIYYLVASELGLIGLFVYLMIIFNIIQHNLKKIVSRETILTHSLSEKIKNTSQHLKNFEVLKKK